MSDVPLDEPERTTVNLVRSSHPWTRADNAAGFVLRYLVPMRRLLTSVLGSTEEADEALKLLLSHLVSAGFGEHSKGRLRDFLLKGIRSAAKTRAGEMLEEQRGEVNLDSVTPESRQWIIYWREGLLERAWRSLERQEHADPSLPLYSVLQCATTNPEATQAMLVASLAAECGVDMQEAEVATTLAAARAQFAQLVADEIAETLENPTQEDVKQEILFLGLSKAFTGVTVAAQG